MTMFGAQARSGRANMLIAGSVIFLIIFIGLAFNHLDSWGSRYVMGRDTARGKRGD